MGSQYFQCLIASHSGWSFNHGDKVLWASKFFFYFFFKKRWSKLWEPFTILKSGRFNCSSNNFVLFVHRTVLVVKRTVLVRGSGYLGWTVTVRSGSENLEYGYRGTFPLFLTTSINSLVSMTGGQNFKPVMFLCFFCTFVISILILSYQNTISLLFIIHLKFWAWFFIINASKEPKGRFGPFSHF